MLTKADIIDRINSMEEPILLDDLLNNMLLLDNYSEEIYQDEKALEEELYKRQNDIADESKFIDYSLVLNEAMKMYEAS